MTKNTKGFSLVELMVAVTIGLIILVSVSAIFITSKKSYSVQDRLARLQENARFAMQYIMKDVRMAGYYGCLTDFEIGTVANPGTVTSSLNPVPGVSSFVMNLPIEGLKAGTSTWHPSLNIAMPTGTTSVTSKESTCPGAVGSRCTNTDAIAVLLANPSDTSPDGVANPHGLQIMAEMADETSPITVAATTLVKVNDIVTVSDCSSADVFQVTGITSSGGNSVISHAAISTPSPGNSTGTLGHQYKPSEGKLIKFVYRRYYIGTGSSGLPALFRDGTEGQQEIVEGIENMQILYGVDKDAPPDGIPNVYLKPDVLTTADWKNVVSVRVGILAMTVNDKAESTDTDSAAYDVDGDGVTDFTASGDRNKRRVFLSTVMLRNKHE